ncbi:hypothetical protein EQH57_0152 [Dictyocoela roeselum]|nr:hypothetical protein EQH57_0152 [Dictyocoela roeselum]
MPFNKNFNFKSSSKFEGKGQREDLNIQSTYHRFITGLSPLRGHDKMNSSVIKTNRNYQGDFQKRSFKMMLAVTDIETQIEIEILEDISSQDVNAWIGRIKELIKNNSYSKIGGIAIIKSLLSQEIKDLLDEQKDPNKALEHINELKYDTTY